MTALTDEVSIVPDPSGSSPSVPGPPAVPESSIVFNVVWTGAVFSSLEPFLASQVANCGARFRFLANACEPGQVDAMEQFCVRHPDRVVELVEVSTDRMVRHGDALDLVLGTRDDGDHFAFIDPDIIATGPFLDAYLERLGAVEAITAGKELWSLDNVRPADHPGVTGEFFFDQDGFVFGSPHFAIYQRAALSDTTDRWGVGFSTSGNDLGTEAADRLEALGRRYWIYDTAKVVNILLQGDGATLEHRESEHLVHIGGVAHFLAPPSSAPAARDEPPAWGEGSDWGQTPAMVARRRMAAFTAEVIAATARGSAAPPVPADVDEATAERLGLARRAVVEAVGSHGWSPGPAGSGVR